MISKHEALDFAYKIQREYLEKRDIQAVSSFLAPNASWIGARDGEVCTSAAQALEILLCESHKFSNGFNVNESWYETIPISENSCLLYGEFCAVSNPVEGLTPALLHHRVTAVIVKNNNEMLLLHTHISAPNNMDIAVGHEEFHRTNADNHELQMIIEQIRSDLDKRNHDLENLMENIPGAVRHCYNDSFFTFIDMSGSFLSLFGYTRDDILCLFNNQYFNMIYPADRRTVLHQKQEQIAKGLTSLEYEYRVTCKDGKVIWILDKGKIVKDINGEESIFCMLVDINKRKEEQEELRLSLQRHQIIMNQAADIIFEWDIKTDAIIFSSNWEKKFGYTPATEHVSELYPVSSNISKADSQAFHKLHEAVCNGVPFYETEIRIREKSGDFIWCKIRATTQFNMFKEPIKAVGVILDCNEEKKQQQILEDLAQKDTLTGLLNKGATKNKVNELILENGSETLHAMLIIDIDNFKTINDKLGHLCGDAVLIKMAEGLQKIFRTTDVIGRIGGDEFLVFLPNLPEIDTIKKRLEQTLDIFHTLQQELATPISCSVGVSFYPNDASDYAELYRCSDIALYKVKNNIKDSFLFYNKEMEIELPFNVIHTEIDNANNSVQSQNLDQELVQYILRMLYSTVDIETAVNHILKIVGQAYDVSRVYIFENSEDGGCCNNTFEWCSAGISPQIELLQNISYEKDLGGYFSNFDENGIFYCQDIHKLHPSLYDILASQGVVSLLQSAIRDDGCFKGYVGFDECRKNRYWTLEQINSLTLISNVLSTFLLHYRLKEQLGKLSKAE